MFVDKSLSVDKTLNSYLASARAGDANALYHLRSLVLKLRWIGMDKEASATVERIKSAVPRVRTMSTNVFPPSPYMD